MLDFTSPIPREGLSISVWFRCPYTWEILLLVSLQVPDPGKSFCELFYARLLNAGRVSQDKLVLGVVLKLVEPSLDVTVMLAVGSQCRETVKV